MKKKFWLLLISSLLLVCGIIYFTTDHILSIPVDEAHFPDSVFREMVTEFDLDGNGSLSREEIQKVTYVQALEKGVKSLRGIEYLTDITNIVCQDNQLTELDISHNLKLERLMADYTLLCLVPVH